MEFQLNYFKILKNCTVKVMHLICQQIWKTHHVWLCATPEKAVHQLPCPWDLPGKSTGSGLPLPSLPSQTRRSLFCIHESQKSLQIPNLLLSVWCSRSSQWLSIMEELRNSSTNSSTNSVHAFRLVLLFWLTFLSLSFFFTNCWKWWSQQSNIAMPAAKAIEILPHLI